MNKNNNFQLKAILTIAFMLCQFSVVSFGQITMFDNSKSELEPQNVAYDSLYNIKKVKSRHPNYDYLIGQRLFFYQDYDLHGSTRNYLNMFFRVRSDGKKEEVQSSNFIQKYFDVISIDYSGGTSIFNMVETSSNEKIVLKSLGGLDNKHWLVQGYYEKAQKDYVGKIFVLNKNAYTIGDGLLKKEDGIMDTKIPMGTEFECTGVSLHTEGGIYGRSPERSNVILFFKNLDRGEYFMFLDRSFNGLRDRKTLDIFLTKEDYQKELAQKEQKDQTRKAELQKRKASLIQKYGHTNGTLISEGKVRIGMTKEMCRESWGEPEDINKTTSSYGTHEQWVYGYGSYLYFENGKLTTIQN